MESREVLWTRPRSDIESAYEDVDRCRAMSPAERVAEAAALSRAALAFLERHDPVERRRLLEQEPLDPAHEQAWRDLIRRSRAG